MITAEFEHSVGKQAHREWLAVCDCGNYTRVRSGNLRHNLKPVRSCGCLIQEANKIRPYESLYNRLMRVAKNQNRECTLTYGQFLEFTKEKECHYCGESLNWEKSKHSIGSGKKSRYQIDRKDNKRGYSKKNCVACCKSCNLTKGDRFTYSQFVKIGEVIRGFKCP